MQKIFKILGFSIILCFSGCSSSSSIKSIVYEEDPNRTIKSIIVSPNSLISEEQLAKFSETDSNTDLKNRKIKNTFLRSPVTWHVITPRSSNSNKKRQYNSDFDLELTDQAFKGHPTKFITKEQVFSSKSTDYDKTPEEIMNKGDFELAKHHEITIEPYYITDPHYIDPLSARPKEKFEDIARLTGYRESYRDIDREKALGLE